MTFQTKEDCCTLLNSNLQILYTRGRMMAKIFAASSGYRLVENDGLASHGGFKDWFLSEFERPGFTFEIGRGENPLPLSSFERIYEKLEETLLLAALM